MIYPLETDGNPGEDLGALHLDSIDGRSWHTFGRTLDKKTPMP